MCGILQLICGENADCEDLVDNTRREKAELALLHEIAVMLAKTQDFSQVADDLLREIAERMSLLRTTITVLDRELGEVAIEHAHGLRFDAQARGR